MLGALLPLFGVLRNLSSVRAGLQALFVAGLVKQWKTVFESERAQKLGTNPFVEEEKAKDLAKVLSLAGQTMSNTEAADIRESLFAELEYFVIDEKSVPRELDFFVGEWCVTPKEKAGLRDAIRKCGLEARVGDEAEKLMELCTKSGLRYDALDFLWRLQELPVDIEALKIVSTERLKEPEIRKQFGFDRRQ